MKKLLLTPIFVLIVFNVCSQNLDLIVTQNGDSLACRIDSVTDMNIYFEMKGNNKWINTNMTLNQVAEYKYDVIDRRKVDFKPGSSFILSKRKVFQSILDLPKNSVFFETIIFTNSICYQRLLPISKQS